MCRSEDMWPNHALQRTAVGRRGCNRRVLWPPALMLIVCRSAAIRTEA
jgi:hypothetical protein